MNIHDSFRESARDKSTGRFGTQPLSETGVGLDTDVAPEVIDPAPSVDGNGRLAHPDMETVDSGFTSVHPDTGFEIVHRTYLINGAMRQDVLVTRSVPDTRQHVYLVTRAGAKGTDWTQDHCVEVQVLARDAEGNQSVLFEGEGSRMRSFDAPEKSMNGAYIDSMAEFMRWFDENDEWADGALSDDDMVGWVAEVATSSSGRDDFTASELAGAAAVTHRYARERINRLIAAGRAVTTPVPDGEEPRYRVLD